MSIVFFGSPDFAVSSLKALIEADEMVSAVVTQPDKARGRGRKKLPSPVKQYALENGIKVLSPINLKDEAFIAELESLRPEFLVVVAYGRILHKRLLSLPSLAPVNVHASMLPKYRGASPIAWALLKGDRETGVTTILMNEGLDAGAILLQEKVAIHEDDTAGSLSQKLSIAGGGLLLRTLKAMRDGDITPRDQGPSDSEYARLLIKDDGYIDWEKTSQEIHNRVRALSPWPSAYCFLDGKRIKLTRTAIGERDNKDHTPGTVTLVGPDFFEVATADGSLKVLEIQPEGKRLMPVKDFLSGHRIEIGAELQ